MSKVQPRRTISLNRDFYEAAINRAERYGVSASTLVEFALRMLPENDDDIIAVIQETYEAKHTPGARRLRSGRPRGRPRKPEVYDHPRPPKGRRRDPNSRTAEAIQYHLNRGASAYHAAEVFGLSKQAVYAELARRRRGQTTP